MLSPWTSPCGFLSEEKEKTTQEAIEVRKKVGMEVFAHSQEGGLEDKNSCPFCFPFENVFNDITDNSSVLKPLYPKPSTKSFVWS